MATYDYEIGANAGARQNVEDLIDVPPHSEHVRFPVLRQGGDGISEGDGFPETRWEFEYLTRADFNTLMGYITGASTVVSIKTRLDTGVYQAYATAVMHRCRIPQDARPAFLGYRNITIRFTRLEV